MGSAQGVRIRRDFLVGYFAESLALASRLFDWRSAAVAAALAGIAAVSLLAVPGPPWQALAFVVLALVVTAWALRRRQLAVTIYGRLTELAEEERHTPSDPESTADLPLYARTASDARSLDELDRVLHPSRNDRVALYAASRRLRVGGFAILVFALLSLAAAVVGLATIAIEGGSLFVISSRILFVVALAAPGFVLLLDVLRHGTFAVTDAARSLSEARIRLPELALLEPTFTTGTVIRSTGDSYLIDPNRMLVRPTVSPQRLVLRRILPWVLLGFAICLAVVWAAEAALHSVTQFLF